MSSQVWSIMMGFVVTDEERMLLCLVGRLINLRVGCVSLWDGGLRSL